jgi:Na+/H+ antiporter NhaD/arsenite permease-like protein
MIIATIIFLVTLVLIFTEWIPRTIVAIGGAATMVGVGIYAGFYSEEQAIEAIDFHTLGLLLGMMTLVALLQPTGFFQYLATLVARSSRGKPVLLLVLLGTVTTVLSMLLDNVTTVVIIAPVAILISEILGVSVVPTTVVIIAPVAILISEILGVSVVPFLMALALLSDTGGAGTLIGDPPNVMIGSAAGLSFTDFLVNALPVVIVAWFVVLGLLLFLFRTELRQPPANAEAVQRLDPAKALDDPVTARKVIIVLAGTVLLFFLQELLGLSSSFIALAGAGVALLWIRPNTQEVFERIEWNVLIFFIALFVMVGGLESSGALDQVAEVMTDAASLNPVLLGIIFMWVVAILSAIVDNIPITIALIPVILQLGESGINTAPLWWALVFGAGFGGNGTIIGSSANIVVASLSERTRTPITSAMCHLVCGFVPVL